MYEQFNVLPTQIYALSVIKQKIFSGCIPLLLGFADKHNKLRSHDPCLLSQVFSYVGLWACCERIRYCYEAYGIHLIEC